MRPEKKKIKVFSLPFIASLLHLRTHMPHSSEEELIDFILDADLPVIGSVWRHYKGELYVVQGTALLESNEQIAVIYISQNTRLPIPWCRTLKEWYETVTHGGEIVQRFTMVK